jgi:hypothetical protein
MAEPRTEVFAKPTYLAESENYLSSRQFLLSFGRVLLGLSWLSTTMCVLLWIWTDNLRWGQTGLVLFLALLAAAMFVVPAPETQK